MTKILFVCSANVDRSPTAEHIYSNHPGWKVKSAGVSLYARTPVSAELVEWSDIIFTMEDYQRQRIMYKFADVIAGKTIVSLNIPDQYVYMSPLLVEIIKEKVDAWMLENTIR